VFSGHPLNLKIVLFRMRIVFKQALPLNTISKHSLPLREGGPTPPPAGERGEDGGGLTFGWSKFLRAGSSPLFIGSQGRGITLPWDPIKRGLEPARKNLETMFRV